MARKNIDLSKGNWYQPILQAVAAYNFQDTKHIHALVGARYPQTNVKNAISTLIDEELLELIPASQVGRSKMNDPWTLRITPAGRQYLEDHAIMPPVASLTDKATPHNVKLHNALADFEVAFNALGYVFNPFGDILVNAPQETRELEHPDCFLIGDKHWITPDAIFSVDFHNGNWACFCLELDLTNHGEDYYDRKGEFYQQVIFDRIYQRQFNMKQYMYVLTICTNEKHGLMVKRAMERSNDENRPSAFLFKVLPQYGSNQGAPDPVPDILTGWLGDYPNLGELNGYNKASRAP